MALPTGNLVARWRANTGVTVTGSGVSEWVDSENSHTMTQDTDADRPVVRTDVDGITSIYFTGGNHLDLPGTLTHDKRAVSVFVAIRGGHNGTQSIYHIGPSSTVLALYCANDQLNVFSSSAKASGTRIGDRGGIESVGMTCGASGGKIWNGAQSAAITVNTTGTQAGGFVGLWNGGTFPLLADIFEIVVYDTELSDANAQAVIDYFNETYGAVASDSDKYIAFEGDSLTEGSVGLDELTESYPFLLTRLYSGSEVPQIHNDASGGDQITSGMSPTGFDIFLGSSSGYANTIAVLWAGTNDINNAKTTAAITAAIDSWITGRRSAGADVIVLLTILPRGDFIPAEETIRGEVNTHIRTVADADIVIDVAADSRLDDETDLTYFNADEIHLTKAGNDVVAELVKAGIDEYFGTPTIQVTLDPNGTPTIVSSGGTLNWGTVANSTIATRAIEIENTGDATLTITDATSTTSGADADQFEKSSGWTGSDIDIAPGATQQLAISFNSAGAKLSAATYVAALSIVSNDAASPFVLNLSATIAEQETTPSTSIRRRLTGGSAATFRVRIT